MLHRCLRLIIVMAAIALPLSHSVGAQNPPGQTTPPVAVAQTPAQTPPPPPYPEWLAALREEALTRGISQATVDLALGKLELLPLAVTRDRTQPEEVLTLDTYVERHLTASVIASGQAVAAKHATLLKKVSDAYGVPAPIIVGVWGLESNFGKVTGTRPIIAVLATLAYDGRRSALFRSELFSALTILDTKHMAIEDMIGSWAGAMGQPQFMPSSYLKFAVDFDGDGRADIWKSEADVFASVANYLKLAGWDPGQRWGREVRAPREALDRVDAEIPMRATGCKAIKEMSEAHALTEWTKLGITLDDGKPLPASALAASLVRGDKRHFLVYKNYDAILNYNCANSYALTVALLADKISMK